MENVECKAIITTGASSGIGEQTARGLVAAGANVDTSDIVVRPTLEG